MALRERKDCVVALLTGNLVRGAEIKLSHYGVWDYFEFGAFADDHHERNELRRFACARALEKHGEEFSPENIFVIGDTPRDIECGKVIGAKQSPSPRETIRATNSPPISRIFSLKTCRTRSTSFRCCSGRKPKTALADSRTNYLTRTSRVAWTLRSIE